MNRVSLLPLLGGAIALLIGPLFQGPDIGVADKTRVFVSACLTIKRKQLSQTVDARLKLL